MAHARAEHCGSVPPSSAPTARRRGASITSGVTIRLLQVLGIEHDHPMVSGRRT